MYAHTFVYIHIYMQSETQREKERERELLLIICSLDYLLYALYPVPNSIVQKQQLSWKTILSIPIVFLFIFTVAYDPLRWNQARFVCCCCEWSFFTMWERGKHRRGKRQLSGTLRSCQNVSLFFLFSLAQQAVVCPGGPRDWYCWGEQCSRDGKVSHWTLAPTDFEVIHAGRWKTTGQILRIFLRD